MFRRNGCPCCFNVLPDVSRADFVLAVFLGLLVYQLAAETMNVSPSVVVTNPNLVKKVVFPLEVLPLAQLGAAWFNFLVSLALMLAGALMLRHIGERAAGDRLEQAIAAVVAIGKDVTYDLKPERDDPTAVGTKEFADAVIKQLAAVHA